MGFLTSPPLAVDLVTLEVYYGISSPWAFLGAPELDRIASQYGLTIHLKPITVIVENGGLKSRHEARRAYHALDLSRYASLLGVPMKASPKYYPQPPGGIEVSAQAIIRLQQHYGVGSETVRRFSYEVQRCIWVTEEGDHCDVEVLRAIARRCGIEESVVSSAVVDHRSDHTDAGVREWYRNHQEAIGLGIFGTPNYVVNGEIFWGQDRLNMVELRIRELLASGATPRSYS